MVRTPQCITRSCERTLTSDSVGCRQTAPPPGYKAYDYNYFGPLLWTEDGNPVALPNLPLINLTVATGPG